MKRLLVLAAAGFFFYLWNQNTNFVQKIGTFSSATQCAGVLNELRTHVGQAIISNGNACFAGT
jgi:hypothetical protein